MISPLVSIVMGTYKRSAIIGRTLNSILEQSYKNVEIIIVDDNHECDVNEIENTKKIIYGLNDERIRYVKNKVNLGHPANFRKCLDQVSGDYFMLFSDDDELVADALEIMVNVLELNNSIGIVHGLDRINYPDGKFEIQQRISDSDDIIDAKKYLLHGLLHSSKYGWSQSSCLYRSDYVKYHQIEISDSYTWDSKFHHDYLRHCQNVGYINKVIGIRNEEYRHTGALDSFIVFVNNIEYHFEALKWIDKNEIYLINKNINVTALRLRLSFLIFRKLRFIHKEINQVLFAMNIFLKQISKVSVYLVMFTTFFITSLPIRFVFFVRRICFSWLN